MLGNESVDVEDMDKIEEAKGKLSSQAEEKLMHSVLSNDKKSIENGKLINSALNQGIGSLNPDVMFEKMKSDYKIAEDLYGKTLLRQITGYDPKYIERNINIPEFQKELNNKINQKIKELEKEGILKKGEIEEKGIELASLVMYSEELDHITPKGILGEKINKKNSFYGDADGTKNFKRQSRYRDIAIRKSVKVAIRRGHEALSEKDLRARERKSKGQISIVYAIDASGSMKGEKIEKAKKAGVALAYKAIEEKDKVGLIVFGSEIKTIIEPTNDFYLLLKEITKIRASKQTDIAATLRKAVEIFPRENITKHLILLTDAVPTTGEKPIKETLEGASFARSNNITISLVGIKLEQEGKKLAEQIVQIGEGRLYVCRNLKELDKIILEDYYSVV